MIELRNAPISVAHVVHPRPVKWNELIRFISDELKLPVVPFADWVNRLEKLHQTEETLRKTQAVHLLELYKGAIRPTNWVHNEQEVMGLATFKTEATTGVVEALSEKNLPQICKKDAMSWIGYWRRKGNLN